jgi:hypothetical protein
LFNKGLLLRSHVNNLFVTVQFVLLKLTSFLPVLAVATSGEATTPTSWAALVVSTAATSAPGLIRASFAVVIVVGSAFVSVFSVLYDFLVVLSAIIVLCVLVKASTATATTTATAERSTLVISIASASVAATTLTSWLVGAAFKFAVVISIVVFPLAVGLSLCDSTGVRCRMLFLSWLHVLVKLCAFWLLNWNL